MLLRLTVENFASIRDRQVFDMYAARRKHGRDFGPSPWKRPEISPVAVIFGGNASGKSTLVSAFAYVASMVEDSFTASLEETDIPFAPFRLDPAYLSQPSYVAIEFVAKDGLEYAYEFAVDGGGVVNERLDVFKTHKRTMLFDRRRDSSGDVWNFGRGLVGVGNRIAESCTSKALFLSAAAANRRATPFRPALQWLTRQLGIYDARDFASEHRHVIARLRDEPGFRDVMDAFIQFADVGSTDIQVVDMEYSAADIAEMRSAFEEFRSALPNGGNVDFEDFVKYNSTSLQLRHRGVGEPVPLPFHLESAGTHALISFASLAITALARGAVHVVDEIDSSLHPLLVQSLVSIFLDPKTNPLQAQLICTTHDATLIDRRVGPAHMVQRDQVWLVEKGPDGATELVPLSSFTGARDEDNLARRYLSGRWGGVPNLALGDSLARAIAAAVERQLHSGPIDEVMLK